MKIAVMVGSLRQESFNRKVFETYCARAKEGIEFIEVGISDFPLYSQDIQDKGFPRSVKDAANIIRGSEGVLFFSPEYNYSVPGVLKNALDWLSRLDNMPLDGKRVSVLGASPAQAGTARMQYDLRKMGVFMNMIFMNKPEVQIGKCMDKFDDDGGLSDEKTLEILDKHREAFLEFIG